MRNHLTAISVFVALGVLSCAGSDKESNTEGGGGAPSAVGGAAGTLAGNAGGLAGASVGNGGTSNGGSSMPVGGTASGGSSVGGRTAFGGAANAGSPIVGGQPNGGAPTFGGGTSGGAPLAGGNLNGGALSAGGGLNGGAPPSGGSSDGGVPPMGGGLNGGTSSGGASGAGIAGGEPGTGGVGLSGSGGEAGAAAGSPPIPKPELITSGKNAYWQEGELAETTDNATVEVDTGTKHQKWIGFGGTFNEMGWDALSLLSTEERDRAIKLLFDAVDGAGFDWGRIPIGASDYAMDRYTLNDTEGDYAMDDFSIERDREMLIPYIHAALAVNPQIKFWASPWSPPAWMKDSKNIDGTDAPPSGGDGTFKSHMLSDSQTLDAFALYLARFVEEYAKENIVIQHVQPQNEPGYATRYPSCLWTAPLLSDFVRDHLGPTFTQRNLTTEIWFGTMSAPEDKSHLDGILGDDAALDLVKGFGLQWNTMDQVSRLAATGRNVIQSEHKCGNYPWETFDPNQPPNDHAYAKESWGYIRDWIKAGVHAYSAWNMVLDEKGQNIDLQRPWPQNALLVVNRSSNKLTPTPAYYVFRHVSQYVEDGATRIEANGGDALAFQNPDGSVVTILHNSNASPSQVVLQVGSTKVAVTIPAEGWATVNLAGA